MLRSFFLFSIFTKIMAFVTNKAFVNSINVSSKFKALNRILMIYFGLVLLAKIPYIMVPAIFLVLLGVKFLKNKE